MVSGPTVKQNCGPPGAPSVPVSANGLSERPNIPAWVLNDGRLPWRPTESEGVPSPDVSPPVVAGVPEISPRAPPGAARSPVAGFSPTTPLPEGPEGPAAGVGAATVGREGCPERMAGEDRPK